MTSKNDHLGSGLGISDGSGYSTAQRPSAFVMEDMRWRAAISGVENGTLVRSWIGAGYTTRREALTAAETEFEARQSR